MTHGLIMDLLAPKSYDSLMRIAVPCYHYLRLAFIVVLLIFIIIDKYQLVELVCSTNVKRQTQTFHSKLTLQQAIVDSKKRTSVLN